jgi:hypothetical protein
MSAWEVVTGRLLNPGAALVALGPNTGDTFQIRSTPSDSNAQLQGIWALCATAGIVRVRSPRMHDFIQGVRYQVPAALVRNFIPDELWTPMFSQDLVTFEIAGGAAETDSAALLFYYPDLGGSVQRLATWEQVKPLIAEILTLEVAVAGPVVAGDWSPGTAINATFDLLKGNQDYAILGYQTATQVLAVAVKGSDTANLKVGGPGPTESIETRDWFISLSKSSGQAAIPVINQANRASTLAHVALNAAAGTINVDLIMARLVSKFA